MVKLLEKIYYSLPLFLQNFAISMFGIHWYRRRLTGIFQQEVEACRKREFYSAEQWEEYETQNLRKILLHAFRTVPYYGESLRKAGLTEAELENFTLKDLNKLPIVSKNDLRKYGETTLLSSQREPAGEFMSSSGSTGTPTRILYSKRMHQQYFGIFEARINNWAGITYKDPRGNVGGRRILREGVAKPPFYRYNFIEKQAYFSAYHISAQTAANYVEGIRKHKLVYMTGHASSNYFLARFIEEAGIKAPKLKGVLTSSDKLTPEMRNTFRRVYRCETFESYNGVEACNLISECAHGRLHVIPDVGIVEVLDSNGNPCKPGEIGEVISTGFLNFDQPLIRYRMGDLVKLSKETSCPCGHHMTIVDEIVGRLEDTVIGQDGREMVRFHTVFINLPSIVEAQIVQHTLKEFEIKLVVSKPLTEDEFNTLRTRMMGQLGEVDVKFSVVESIPRSANGKFKAVVSHVKRTTDTTKIVTEE